MDTFLFTWIMLIVAPIVSLMLAYKDVIYEKIVGDRIMDGGKTRVRRIRHK